MKELTPLELRQYILNLEDKYELTIRVHEHECYVLVGIDKEDKQDE